MLIESLMKLFSLCWCDRRKAYSKGVRTKCDGAPGFDTDGWLWYRDIGEYGSGEFSVAVLQANQVMEDQFQIESGQFGTFVGVYDGHGGPEAARYVCDHLFRHFRAISAQDIGVVSTETIKRAFDETERGFTELVS